jgi:hypothetical protein
MAVQTDAVLEPAAQALADATSTPSLRYAPEPAVTRAPLSGRASASPAWRCF